MNSMNTEQAASMTILAVGYRAQCTETECRNLGRPILRDADTGGRRMSNAEFCHAHARARIACARGAMLKVYEIARLRKTVFQPAISCRGSRPATAIVGDPAIGLRSL
jgi:hypothetical protein